MTQRVALIVGGTSGIGRGVALHLANRKVKTFVIGRRYQEGSKFIHPIKIDLASNEAINLIKQKLVGIKLDYIIFSIGTEAPLKRFEEISEEDYNYAFLLNVKIPFFLTKALMGNLSHQARLLLFTSRLASAPEEGSLVYCMTKSSLEVLSTGLNKELHGKILCSSIIPGIVDTEMQKRLREADPKVFPHAHTYQAMQPRLQSVEEVSGYITQHLCDTDDELFAKQKVSILDVLARRVGQSNEGVSSDLLTL